MPVFLGLDFGTGGCKGCLIDENANVLSYAFREYPIITNTSGWSEHTPSYYWLYTCEIIEECKAKAGVSSGDIVCAAVSSALPSMVMVDRDGNTINNAYNLMDRRAREEVDFVNAMLGADEVFAITGNRLEDHPSLVNLLWEKKNRPESYAKIHKILTIDGYILFKLTDKYSLNYSAAAFYGIAFDIRKKEFNTEIISSLGLDAGMLPDLFPCEDVVGHVSLRAADEAGLKPGMPVVAGQVDCNAAWLGAGAIFEGDIQVNLGTCGNFGIIHKDDNFDNRMIVCPYTKDSANTYITIPTTTTGGQIIRYIRDNFSAVEVEVERLTGESAYDLLEKQAQKIGTGSDGLIVLPFLMGERTPIWDPYARGAVIGLTLAHSKPHIVKACMEAVAYALYDSYRLVLATGRKINTPIVFNEGGAKNRMWRQIITDVFNVPTVIVKNRIGAPYGDAILAGVSVGCFAPDFSIAREKAEYIDELLPDKKRNEIYMEYFTLYKRSYDGLKSVYRDLYNVAEKARKLEV